MPGHRQPQDRPVGDEHAAVSKARQPGRIGQIAADVDVDPVARADEPAWPVDAGRRTPQLSSPYQISYSGSIQYGSKRLIPSSAPRAAAIGASIPIPLWHQIARPPWRRVSR